MAMGEGKYIDSKWLITEIEKERERLKAESKKKKADR